MEYYITGCKDCPFYYDDTDGQAGYACHHMAAPTDLILWENGNATKLPFDTPEGLYQLKTDNGTYSLSVQREPKGIELSPFSGNDPITPEWCPLKTEHTVITLKQQDK